MGIDNEMTRTGDTSLDSTVRPQKVQNFYGNGKDVIVVSNHINANGKDVIVVSNHINANGVMFI